MQHVQENTQQLKTDRERQGHGSEIAVIWNNQQRPRRVQEEGGAENCWVAEVIDSPDNDG